MWKILLFLIPSATFGYDVSYCTKNVFDAGIVEGSPEVSEQSGGELNGVSV